MIEVNKVKVQTELLPEKEQDDQGEFRPRSDSL
jgi:hypothetical protein